MRDARRIHERVEVRLERMQVIWLTLGMVVALGLVFALGVVVGRRAARLEPAAPEADPIAQLDEDGELHQELTFYTRLTEPEAKAEDVAAAPRERPTASSTPGRLAQAPPMPATSVEAPPNPKPAGDAADSVTAPATAPISAPGPDDELTAALSRGPARAGEYTVQVSSFQTSEEARAYAGALERKGYRPFVVSAEIAGRGMWYRVRLGSFKDEETAKSAKTLLARSDIPAWVLRTE